MKRLSELDGKFAGQTAWVIGRGPSLERLTASHIGPGPVIAVNQAITQVERLGLSNSLFSLQKDRFFGRPMRAAILLHTHESLLGLAAVDLLDEAYCFDAEADYGLPWNTPSVAVAAEMARKWGCIQVVYLCCDAVTDGDTRAFGDPATYPEDYLRHGEMVREAARIPVEWRRCE